MSSGSHSRFEANRRHSRWLGWRAPVSACYFPISVAAWRELVQFLTETGCDGAHRGAERVIAEGLEHPQGPHRVHIQYMGPGFVVDIASLLPRRAGNPRAVDEHVDSDILELCCCLPDAFRIDHIHCNDLKHALCVLRQTLKLCCGGRAAARSKHAPSVSHVLTDKFEAKPTTGARDEDCCCHRMLSVLMNALLPNGFAEPRRFRKIACSYSAQG